MLLNIPTRLLHAYSSTIALHSKLALVNIVANEEAIDKKRVRLKQLYKLIRSIPATQTLQEYVCDALLSYRTLEIRRIW
jgi:hypothetical protein